MYEVQLMAHFYSFSSLLQVSTINLCPELDEFTVQRHHCLKSSLCYPAIYIEVS